MMAGVMDLLTETWMYIGEVMNNGHLLILLLQKSYI